MVGAELSWTKSRNKCRFSTFDHRRRQHQCIQTEKDSRKQTTPGNSSNMASSFKVSPINNILPTLLFFLLLLVSWVGQAHSSQVVDQTLSAANQTLRPEQELKKSKIIRARLKKINKPAVKTIQVFDSHFLCFLLCFLLNILSFFFFFFFVCVSES